MDSESLSNFSATVATSDLEVPTQYARSDDFRSMRNEPPLQPPPCQLEGYIDIDWKRLTGYSVPADDYEKKSKIWDYGYRLQEAKSGRFYWLCKRCHISKRALHGRFKEALYLCDKASSAQWAHLKSYHNIDQDGNEINKPPKRPKLMETWTGAGNSEAEAAANIAATAFEQHQFQALLYDWIIHDNVSFNQLQSERLRKLLVYLNPRCERVIPHRTTASRTIARLYDKCLGTVTETLKSALSRVSLSFDLWTSPNNLALLGLYAHFIDIDGRPVTSLLSLPRQSGRHSGSNVVDIVSFIIAEYNLEDKLGWFTTDNASSNKSCIDALASEYRFNSQERWIRCAGHVFNLVGQAALLGSDSDAFAEEISAIDLEEMELIQWRRKGPIGKLHNVVHWINRSPQRCERFELLQLQLITPLKPEGKKDVYGLIKDVTTRWNSFYDAAERAVYLQPAIDELLSEQQVEYDKYINGCKLKGRPAQRIKPVILEDCLTVSDWSVVKQYLAILKPLKEATVTLQGHIGGKCGSIWQVLPVYEQLLNHFEEQVRLYPIKEQLKEPDSHSISDTSFSQTMPDVSSQLASLPANQTTGEHHFAVNIKLAWSKLNDYYLKLDNSPVYVAAVVLHPRFKWRHLDKAWAQRPEWLKAAKRSFNSLLVDYSVQSVQIDTPLKKSDVNNDSDCSSDDELEGSNIHQQLADYIRCKDYREHVLTKEHSPIDWWRLKRSSWPHLAALALDIYSIAVMSDEPERVFSTTGAAVIPWRRLISSDMISHLMCLKAWSQSKVIQFDKGLFQHLPAGQEAAINPSATPVAASGAPSTTTPPLVALQSHSADPEPPKVVNID